MFFIDGIKNCSVSQRDFWDRQGDRKRRKEREGKEGGTQAAVVSVCRGPYLRDVVMATLLQLFYWCSANSIEKNHVNHVCVQALVALRDMWG